MLGNSFLTSEATAWEISGWASLPGGAKGPVSDEGLANPETESCGGFGATEVLSLIHI